MKPLGINFWHLSTCHQFVKVQQQDIIFLSLLIFFRPPHKVNSVTKEDKHPTYFSFQLLIVCHFNTNFLVIYGDEFHSKVLSTSLLPVTSILGRTRWIKLCFSFQGWGVGSSQHLFLWGKHNWSLDIWMDSVYGAFLGPFSPLESHHRPHWLCTQQLSTVLNVSWDIPTATFQCLKFGSDSQRGAQ